MSSRTDQLGKNMHSVHLLTAAQGLLEQGFSRKEVLAVLVVFLKEPPPALSQLWTNPGDEPQH